MIKLTSPPILTLKAEMNAFFVAMLLTLACIASGNPANAATRKETCPKAEWTKACFDHTAAGRRIKGRYLNRIKFQKNGFAVIHLDPYETVAVNKKGDVVVPGIVSGNYDYRDAKDCIAMFSIPAKNATSSFNRYNCGFFRLSDFKIIVPPVYNRCEGFHNQTAYVCKNCRPDCIECNVVAYYGGEGFVINKNNDILRRVSLPKLPLCTTVEGVGGYPKNQPCRATTSADRGD